MKGMRYVLGSLLLATLLVGTAVAPDRTATSTAEPLGVESSHETVCQLVGLAASKTEDM